MASEPMNPSANDQVSPFRKAAENIQDAFDACKGRHVHPPTIEEICDIIEAAWSSSSEARAASDVRSTCSQPVAPRPDVRKMASWLAVRMPCFINLDTSEREPLAQWLTERITEYLAAPPQVSAARPMPESLDAQAERIVSNMECATQFEFRQEDDYRNTLVLNVRAGLERALRMAGAVSAPRCPSCREQDLRIAKGRGECQICGHLADLSQFFQPRSTASEASGTSVAEPDAQPSPEVSE